ncbi:MAG: hypothetical protein JO082_09365 [Mycobacterium sp.]|nr:hypothetical protein [Mycobacterium sp.]MBV9722113.1 hypothetical protein [Mycobacterium sp.]
MVDDSEKRTTNWRLSFAASAIIADRGVCACAIVASVGLTGLLGSAVATASTGNEVNTIAADGFAGSTPAMPLTNVTIVLPGADDTIYLPNNDTINFPFGGDGEINFFSPGNPGTSGGVDGGSGSSAPGLEITSPPYELITPTDEWTIPFLNDTIVFPGSDDTIVWGYDNTINLPFMGDGEIVVLGERVGGNSGSSLPDSAIAAGNAVTIPLDPAPAALTDDTSISTVYLPGSDDAFVLFSGDTVNLPFGGVGENNFGGGGNGGDSGASLLATAIPTANPENAVATPLITEANDTSSIMLPWSGDTLSLFSGDTLNFPFGGVEENSFGGGGNGGNGGSASGDGSVAGSGGHGGTGLFGAPGGAGGADAGDGSGVIDSEGGSGGDGGNAAELLPIVNTGTEGSVAFFDNPAAAASAAVAADILGLQSDFVAFDPGGWLGSPF